MATVVGMTADAINAELDALVTSAEFDGSGHLILTLRDATEVDAGAPSLSTPDASTTVKGIVELATTAETSTGTDTVRAVTPAGLDATLDTAVPAKMPSASSTVQGKVELATDAEATTGTDTARATTPANVAAVVAANNTANVTPRPLGVVARRSRTSNSGNTTSSTGVGVIKLSASVISGRKYTVRTNALHLTGGAGDEVGVVFRFTTTGVDPTTSDSILHAASITIANAGRYSILTMTTPYFPGSNHTFKVTMFVTRANGTAGNAAMHAIDNNIYMEIVDEGVPVADAGSGADV